MNRNRKVILNLLIMAILVPLVLYRSGLYLSPLSAHKHSERRIHYGPSQVVYIQDFEEGKYFLCKYDKWISCNTINRELLFFWRFGSQVTGIENDLSKAVSYTWHYSEGYYKVYGIINDERVKKIEGILSDGTVLTQTDFYEDMFLLTWTGESNKPYFIEIKGYDLHDTIIYEDSNP